MGNFGDRIKMYESKEAQRRFLPLLPVCARLDGKSFSEFTKGLRRPYDKRLSDLMTDATIYLVEKSNANMGYCQSDEISLIYYSENPKSQIFFDGKIQKMTSVLTSILTAFFNSRISQQLPEKEGKLAFFDCRVWQVPTLEEAANSLLWRELDAIKNSISMAAGHYYSHKQLHGKTSNERKEMLFKKGVNWDNYPTFFKRGTFVQKRKILRGFTADEIDKLPIKHEARSNPDLVIERTEIKVINMPSFRKVENRAEVVSQGGIPLFKQG